ncbi:MAG: ankyrin repeat domain-containing protein [Candidatus Chromulinivorax sp.]
MNKIYIIIFNVGLYVSSFVQIVSVDITLQDDIAYFKTQYNHRDSISNKTRLLDQCCFNNSHQIAKYIIQQNPYILLQSNFLNKAVFYNSDKVVEELMQFGQDPKVLDLYGNTSLHKNIEAMKYNPQDESKACHITNMFLFQHMNINSKNKYGATALHCIKSNYNEQLIELLGQYPLTDFNMKNQNGYTPLHHTILNDVDTSTAALLKQGANPNIQNKYGNTPLHEAAIYDKHISISALLKAGANKNLENNEHKTAKEIGLTSPNENVINAFEDNIFAKK